MDDRVPGTLNFPWYLLRPVPGVRPGGRVTFFASPKKVTKERRPHCLRPCASLRATCGARTAGLPQNSRRSLRSLCSDSCGKSDHEACLSFGRHAAGCTALLGAARGAGERLGPSLRSADGAANSQKPKYAPWRVGVQSPLRVPRSVHRRRAPARRPGALTAALLPQLDASERCPLPAGRNGSWGRSKDPTCSRSRTSTSTTAAPTSCAT